MQGKIQQLEFINPNTGWAISMDSQENMHLYQTQDGGNTWRERGDKLMETRRFGRSGHLSTVAIFGAFAFSEATQAQADAGMEKILAAGVNHIDVAPSYGIAEERLGPWMPRVRDQFFLGCKTTERSQEGADAEMKQSLKRLQVDHFDLYQIHAITTFEELDEATRSGGALDAIIKAREAGTDALHRYYRSWNAGPGNFPGSFATIRF